MRNFTMLSLSIMLLSFGNAAYAIDGRTCENKANHMKGAEHDTFLKSCVEQLSEPDHVKKVAETQKKSNCEQNAKNKHLPSGQKGEYVNECINKNEAAAAAKEVSAKAQEQSTAPATAAANSHPSKQAAAKSKPTHKKHSKKNKSAA